MTIGKRGAQQWLAATMLRSRDPADRLHAGAALDAMRGVRPAGHETTAWIGALYERSHWADRLILDVVIRCMLEARRV